MQLKLQKILILLSVLALASCGFTLRGTASLPAELQNMVLVSTDGNSDVLRELRRSLIANNVTVLETPESDSYRLVIGEEDSKERILSVNSNARAGEYELSISIPFQLRTADTILIEPEILTIEKVYLADPNNAVAKDEERELMENEMRRELVILILRRLQSVTL
jgi:LPS-assembly lipoprotein